jgi:hypothetical protein
MRYLLVFTAVVCALLAASGIWIEDGKVSPKLVVASFLFYGILVNGVVWMALHARRHRKEVVLALGSVTTALVVSEVALRWVLPERTLPLFRHCRSSRYHHVSPPNRLMYYGDYDGKHVFVKTNEDGLRTRYSRNAFLGHQTRILVLGDSFTFGFGVRQSKGFTQVLENELRNRRPGADVAVLNAGNTSFSPLIESRRLADLAPHYKPNHVLLFLDPSDIGDDLRYATLIENAGLGDGRFYAEDSSPYPYYGALWQCAAPYHLVFTEPFRLSRMLLGSPRKRPAIRSLNRQIEVELDGNLERNRFFIYRYPLDETRPYFDATAGYVNEMAETARRVGADFTLFVSPRYHHWDPNESPQNWERVYYALDEPYQFEYFRYFDELRSQVSYPVVNLLGDFQTTREFPLVFASDPHWNERGHAFVGRTVNQYLLDEFASTERTVK